MTRSSNCQQRNIEAIRRHVDVRVKATLVREWVPFHVILFQAVYENATRLVVFVFAFESSRTANMGALWARKQGLEKCGRRLSLHRSHDGSRVQREMSTADARETPKAH